METEPADARAQIAELDAAVRATTAASSVSPPLWFFPVLGLLGPAIAGVRWAFDGWVGRRYSASQIDLIQFGSFALIAILVLGAVIAGLLERNNGVVRHKPPIRGGRTSKWMFIMIFTITMGVSVAMNWPDIVNTAPFIAGVGFVWFTVAPWIAWSRHAAAMETAP